MKAWVCRQYVDPYEITLEDRPERLPGEGEVQVQMKAAGVNFSESLLLSGNYQVKPPPPYVAGIEGSGIVTLAGAGVTKFKPGDEVIISNYDMDTAYSGGCFAEKATLPIRYVFPKPANLSFIESAGVSSNYGTSYHALRCRDYLRAGETMVVHGSAGGIGSAAVQIGKALGATVIATGSSDEKLAIVKQLGADHVINVTKEPLRERVLEITGGRGADVHYDPVGGELFEASMRCIAPGGRILVAGFTSGVFPKAATNIILVKMISIVGIEYRAFRRFFPEQANANFDEMLELLAQGRLKPYVSHTFKLSELKDAFQAMADRKVIGKAVILNEE